MPRRTAGLTTRVVVAVRPPVTASASPRGQRDRATVHAEQLPAVADGDVAERERTVGEHEGHADAQLIGHAAERPLVGERERPAAVAAVRGGEDVLHDAAVLVVRLLDE